MNSLKIQLPKKIQRKRDKLENIINSKLFLWKWFPSWKNKRIRDYQYTLSYNSINENLSQEQAQEVYKSLKNATDYSPNGFFRSVLTSRCREFADKYKLKE